MLLSIDPMLSGFAWTNETGNGLFTLTGLTAGRNYLLQIFLVDNRDEAQIMGRYSIADGTFGGPAESVFGGSPMPGIVLNGSFRAEGSTQAFALEILSTEGNVNEGTQMNAFQLREL